MPGPNQRYKGLLAFYVDKRGNCEITLGRYFDSLEANNDETQWMWPIRAELEKQAKAFLCSKGVIE